jgi:hypothetical protein
MSAQHKWVERSIALGKRQMYAPNALQGPEMADRQYKDEILLPRPFHAFLWRMRLRD